MPGEGEKDALSLLWGAAEKPERERDWDRLFVLIRNLTGNGMNGKFFGMYTEYVAQS